MLVSISLDGQVQCPALYNETAVVIVHHNLGLNKTSNTDSWTATVAPADMNPDNKEGVGPDGFWDLFDDRHNQSPPNIDSLLKSVNTEHTAQPILQPTGTSGGMGIFPDLFNENNSDEGEKYGDSASAMPVTNFDYDSSMSHHDRHPYDGEQSSSSLVTSVFAYWLDLEP